MVAYNLESETDDVERVPATVTVRHTLAGQTLKLECPVCDYLLDIDETTECWGCDTTLQLEVAVLSDSDEADSGHTTRHSEANGTDESELLTDEDAGSSSDEGDVS